MFVFGIFNTFNTDNDTRDCLIVIRFRFRLFVYFGNLWDLIVDRRSIYSHSLRLTITITITLTVARPHWLCITDVWIMDNKISESVKIETPEVVGVGKEKKENEVSIIILCQRFPTYKNILTIDIT